MTSQYYDVSNPIVPASPSVHSGRSFALSRGGIEGVAPRAGIAAWQRFLPYAPSPLIVSIGSFAGILSRARELRSPHQHPDASSVPRAPGSSSGPVPIRRYARCTAPDNRISVLEHLPFAFAEEFDARCGPRPDAAVHNCVHR